MKRLVWLLLVSCCFAQDVKRPNTDVDSGATIKCGIGTSSGSSTMTLAYDAAGQSTSSIIAIQGSISQSHYRSRAFYNWTAPSGSYSALTLNINAQNVETNSTGSVGGGELKYSLNNGSTWTTIVSGAGGGGWPRLTRTINLSASQDLSQIRVSACVYSTAGGDTNGPTETMTIFDIWTSGTVSGQAPGNGSSAGTRHNAVFIN